MGRKSNTQERRVQIAQGLLSVMKDLGYEKATIKSIAEAASLTPGLIHYHFKNKQQILIFLLEKMQQQAEQRFSSLLADEAKAEEKLIAFIDASLAMGNGANEHAVAAWVVIGSEAVRQTEVRAFYKEIVQQQLDLVSSLVSEILIANGKPDTQSLSFAASIIGSIEGAYKLSAAASEIMPKNYAAKMLKQQVFACL